MVFFCLILGPRPLTCLLIPSLQCVFFTLAKKTCSSINWFKPTFNLKPSHRKMVVHCFLDHNQNRLRQKVLRPNHHPTSFPPATLAFFTLTDQAQKPKSQPYLLPPTRRTPVLKAHHAVLISLFALRHPITNTTLLSFTLFNFIAVKNSFWLV